MVTMRLPSSMVKKRSWRRLTGWTLGEPSSQLGQAVAGSAWVVSLGMRRRMAATRRMMAKT